MPQRNILLYMAAIGLVSFTLDGGIYAVVYNLFVLRLGYGPDFVGLLASVSLVGFTLAGAVAGPLGDRVGSRRMMLFGLGAMAVGLGLMPLTALAPTEYQSFALIALFSAANMGLAVFFVNASPYISAVAAPSVLERAFAYQTALWAFCAFLGSLVGGYETDAQQATTRGKHKTTTAWQLLMTVATGAEAGHALVCPDVRYGAIRWHLAPQIDRRFGSSAMWRTATTELAAGEVGTVLPQDSVTTALLLPEALRSLCTLTIEFVPQVPSSSRDALTEALDNHLWYLDEAESARGPRR